LALCKNGGRVINQAPACFRASQEHCKPLTQYLTLDQRYAEGFALGQILNGEFDGGEYLRYVEGCQRQALHLEVLHDRVETAMLDTQQILGRYEAIIESKLPALVGTN